jgi:hypothetical protein
MEHNMLNDIMDCQWLKDKVRARDSYAQNLYAAMCNMEWQKRDVMPILKDERWGCSWRSAGGIIAQIQGKGDYMDWYCSGMGGFAALEDETEEEAQAHFRDKGYVPEGQVTEEIQEDLLKLGWQPVPYNDDFV